MNISSNIGVKQWFLISPILFDVYMDRIEKYLQKARISTWHVVKLIALSLLLFLLLSQLRFDLYNWFSLQYPIVIINFPPKSCMGYPSISYIFMILFSLQKYTFPTNQDILENISPLLHAIEFFLEELNHEIHS